MKTLDDALKTPGVIEGGAYDTGWAVPWGLFSSVYGCERGGVTLRGRFMPRHLRRIADHLAPPATEEPRGCPLPGACSCSTATLHIDRIKAEARREALEEAVKAAETCDSPFNCPSDEQYEAVDLMARRIADTIRDLIEKESEV